MLLSIVPIFSSLLAAARGCGTGSEPPTFGPKDGLLIIDVQNDFLPARPVPLYSTPVYNIPSDQVQNGTISGGALGVAGGDQIIDILNTWIDVFDSQGATIFASLDWHPADSCSFGSDVGSQCPCGPFSIDTCGEDGALEPPPTCPLSLAHRCQDPVSVSDYEQGSTFNGHLTV